MNYRVKDEIEYRCPKTGYVKTCIIEHINQRERYVSDNWFSPTIKTVSFENIIRVIKRKRKSSAFKKQSYILIDKNGRVEGITKKL